MANVLLVDDNGNVLLTLAIALRRLGHKVTVSSDPCQALTFLKRQQFDFLVSDVRMPHMSGLELAAQAKMVKHVPRIILTSAYSNIEARDGIAEAYLRKPIDVQQLHALLSDVKSSGTLGENGNGPAMVTRTDSTATTKPPARRERNGRGFPGDLSQAMAT
jgi:two-component system response regulator ChvI